MNNIYIFDTSALVEFYSYRTDYHKNLIKKMKKLETYIPEIVKEEIAGKYKNQIETEDFKSGSILDNSSFDNYKKSLEELKTRLQIYKIDASEVKATLAVINNIDNRKITKDYRDFAKKHKEDREKYLEGVSYPCTIIKYPLLDRLNNLENAQLRFENKIPPGYRDNSKGDSLNKYNDYYIWDSILKYFKDKKIDKGKKIYFVTNDFKDTRKNPRDEQHMKREFFETTGHDIELINSKGFLNMIGFKTVEIKAYENMLEQVVQEYFNNESKYNNFIYDNVDYSGYMDENIENIEIKIENSEGKITFLNLIKFRIHVSIIVDFSYTTTYGENDSGTIKLKYNIDYEYDEKTKQGVHVREKCLSEEVFCNGIDYEEELESLRADAMIEEYKRKLSLLVNDIHMENTKELQSVLLQNIGIEDTLKKYSDLWQSTVGDTLKNSSDLLQNMLIINNFEKSLKNIPIHGVEGLEVPLKDLDMEVNNPEIDDKH